MSQELKNVVLLGATGNLGPSLLGALLDSKKFKVTVLSRATDDLQLSSDVRVIKTDYTEPSLTEQLKGTDAIISSISGIDVQKTVIDAAIKAGVKRFLLSEFGGDTSNARGRELSPLYNTKKDVADYVKSKAEANPGFSWTAPMSGPFFDWGLQKGFFGFNVKESKTTLYDEGKHKFSSTNLAGVGKAVVGILLHPEETKNQYIYFESFCISQNDVVAAFEKHTGRKWHTDHTTSVQASQEGKEAMAKGDLWTGIVKTLLSVTFTHEDVGGNFGKEHKLSNDLLGVPQEDIESTVKAYLDGLKD